MGKLYIPSDMEYVLDTVVFFLISVEHQLSRLL